MLLYKNCSDALEACQDSDRFSIAYLSCREKPESMHIHNYLEVFLNVRGGKQFVIDNALYPMHDGDVFLINQFETHRPEQQPDTCFDRYVITIAPSYLAQLSSPETDLSACFYMPREQYRILSLTPEQQKRLLTLIRRATGVKGYGADLVERNILTEILLLLSGMHVSDRPVPIEADRDITKILDFINQSLSEDLSLDMIAEQFYFSKSYLCRMFKKETGTTINKYIFARRISEAKRLLAGGYSVRDTVEQTGFNDYANFIRSFTRTVGVSPKRYGAEHASNYAVSEKLYDLSQS